ncbi:MAG: isoaspartyl peptidase/L-asparaginase [Bacteroidia bacterium]|nr:isoaspartyl peptidase/L-asparaginase [Bacteroidia bacterium]MDW8134770.1 isoaspartyl peptidase/L-asparaginase [Bacteroidia bacterium]
MAQPVAIAIHGGAGNIRPENLPPEKAQKVRAYLQQVVEEGYRLLREGKMALEVVEIAVRRLEDAGYFNAGIGAVPNERGEVELDAAIMDGHSRRAGAVAAAHTVRNPITLARLIMERTSHVLIVGQGADSLATLWDLPLRNHEYAPSEVPWSYGTVGAVALDKYGNLAAATSTGGISGKKRGRVGDTPLIGAGTYAENGVAAISCTGQGEYFIRSVLAYDIAARVRYKQLPISEAIQQAFRERLESIGGQGGVIAVSPSGEIFLYFNTPGMYRASIDAQGHIFVEIFR